MSTPAYRAGRTGGPPGRPPVPGQRDAQDACPGRRHRARVRRRDRDDRLRDGAGPVVRCGRADRAQHHGRRAGVHQTLAGAWDYFRWRPVTGGPSRAGADGTVHPSVDLARQHARQDEVVRELAAHVGQCGSVGHRPDYLDHHRGPALAAASAPGPARTGVPSRYSAPAPPRRASSSELTPPGRGRPETMAAGLPARPRAGRPHARVPPRRGQSRTPVPHQPGLGAVPLGRRLPGLRPRRAHRPTGTKADRRTRDHPVRFRRRVAGYYPAEATTSRCLWTWPPTR